MAPRKRQDWLVYLRDGYWYVKGAENQIASKRGDQSAVIEWALEKAREQSTRVIIDCIES